MNDKIKKIEKILVYLPFDKSIGEVFKLLNDIDKELGILYSGLEALEHYGEQICNNGLLLSKEFENIKERLKNEV